MSRNDGKSLEELVSELERVAAGAGRKVEIRRKLFNENGVQLAEFDIIVSTGEGDHKVEWLIECRNRPSQGAAEVSWIEQLYGRMHLNGFTRAIAVSTTGFSPSAIYYAQKGNIELRLAEELSRPEMWLCNTLITQSKTGFFSTMQINPVDTSDQMRDFLNKHLPYRANELLLHFESLPDPVKPIDVFEKTCLDDAYDIYAGLNAGESKPVQVVYFSEGGSLGAVSCNIHNATILLHSIVLLGSVRIDEHEEPFTSINAIKEAKEETLIGQRISINSSTENYNEIVFLETVNEDGSRKIALKITPNTQLE